jgi:predicted peptidase
MNNTKIIAVAATILIGTSLASAQDAKIERGFLDRVHKDADGKEVKYVLFVPHDYQGDAEFPLILFLHGSGETKGGQKMPVEVGIGPAIKKNEKSFPFITIIPQAQTRNWSANSENGKRAMAMLKDVQKAFKVDPKRIYLTGLSMGGFGTWSLAAAHPDKWAAIVPICGGGNPKDAEKIKSIPCWCFHGDADGAVPVQKSRDMVEALKKAGGSPKYNEYPAVGHNSWDKAYGTKELYDWLLEQKLK